MEEAKKAQSGRLAKLGGLEESLSTQDTITDVPAQSAVDILVRARSAEATDAAAAAAGDGAEATGDKKEGTRHQISAKAQHGSIAAQHSIGGSSQNPTGL